MAVASASTAQSTAGHLAFHARGFELSLVAGNKRPNTIKSYLEAVEQLDAFLRAHGTPHDVENIRREHVESFQADQLARLKPASATNRYRSLQQFFKWLTIEGSATPEAPATAHFRMARRGPRRGIQGRAALASPHQRSVGHDP